MRKFIEKNCIWLTLLPVIFVMVTIFIFSAQVAEESQNTSDEWTDFVIRTFVSDFDGLPAAEQQELRDNVSFAVRKIAHFTEYTILGCALMLHLSAIGMKKQVPRAPLWAWGIGTLYAASDEFHQLFVEGRSMSLRDVGIDSCGVLAGTLIVWLIVSSIGKRRAASKQIAA